MNKSPFDTIELEFKPLYKYFIMRILSKKQKKEVSWNQAGRNRKLVGKATADRLEITAAMEKRQKCSNCQKLDHLDSCNKRQK